MDTTLTADVLQDELAVSLARVLAIANRRARESGVDVPHSLITISQRSSNGNLVWQINYGPKDYVGRRGGDFIVDVDPLDASIIKSCEGSDPQSGGAGEDTRLV